MIQCFCLGGRRATSRRRGKTDFPRSGRVTRPRDRHHADMGSVGWKPEKLHRKDARRGHCCPGSFTSFDVSFRALSGASSDASEEVSVFRPRRCLKRAQALGRRGSRRKMSLFSEYKAKLDIACDSGRLGFVRAFAFAELVCQAVNIVSVVIPSKSLVISSVPLWASFRKNKLVNYRKKEHE